MNWEFLLLGFVMAVAASSSAFLYGLWRGEVGKRKILENMLTYSSPLREPARVAPPDMDAEQRALAVDSDLNEETRARAEDVVRQAAKEAGVALSPEEIRQEAERVILGSGVL